MHSWVFRHRTRLAIVFGVPKMPAVAPAPTLSAAPERRGVRRFKPTHGPRRSPGSAPGSVDRREQDVLLRPMRRPAG